MTNTLIYHASQMTNPCLYACTCLLQVEAVEAVLEQERKAGNAKDARHKLTVERLRQKLVELQVQCIYAPRFGLEQTVFSIFTWCMLQCKVKVDSSHI